MKYDLEKFREALAVVISMGEPEEPPEDCSDDADEAYGKVLDEWQAFALGLDDATMHLIGDFHYDADTGAIAALKSIALLRFGEANDAHHADARAGESGRGVRSSRLEAAQAARSQYRRHERRGAQAV
jgi:hypothetical protein